MRIGIAYDLKSAQPLATQAPDDALEEFDSEETISAIASALQQDGHEVLRLGGGREFLKAVLAATEAPGGLDLVFNIAEGRSGTRSREAQVPAVCEMLGLRYTHSDPLTLAACLDKALAKRLAASQGVPTPAFCLVSSVAALSQVLLPPLPLMVKPNAEGSSMGVRDGALCHSFAAVAEQVALLLRDYGGAVLVEEFLPGVEVTVSTLGNGAGVRVAAMMEIAAAEPSEAPFIYSLQAKRNYQQRVRYHLPPRLPPASLAALERTALAAYAALGCRDLARIDLRLDAEGQPQLIEINPIPGLHPQIGDLPLSCARAGLAYQDLLSGIVRDAMSRPVAGPRA